jgi:GTP:adenosylcobinamide-phosphate guanylyltransferase
LVQAFLKKWWVESNERHTNKNGMMDDITAIFNKLAEYTQKYLLSLYEVTNEDSSGYMRPLNINISTIDTPVSIVNHT